MEGSTNTLTSHGTITSKNGVAGNAIIGNSGNETIDNYGTVTGSVDLGVGSNAFNNRVAATFNSGTLVHLGTGNILTNAGTLSPGGQWTPLTTTLTGNFVQSSSGTFEVEVYKDGEHDKLHVNGDSASLDGTLTVTRGRGPYKNGTTYDIIEVAGAQGISGSFSDILLPEPKPLLSFGVNQRPNIVEVEVYAPKSTTVAKNRVGFAIGNYLDRIMPLAKGDLSDVLGEIQDLSEPGEFSTAFSSLSPDSYDNYTRGTLFSAQQYGKSLQYRMNNVRYHLMAGSPDNEKPILVAYRGSDASLDQLFSPGALSQVQGKNGLWLDAFGQWGDQDEEDGFTGYDYFMRGATLGFDHRVMDKLMAGLSLGYSRSDIDLDRDQGSGDVKNLFGSLYGSYFDRNLYIDAILSYVRNWYDNSRLIRIGGILREARSDHDAHLFSGYLGGGYYFDFNPWAFGPYGSLQYIRLDEESFTEKGAGGVSLRVDDRQTDALVSELGLRMVGHFKGKYGNFLPEVSLGWGHDFDIDDHVVRASFAGSPGSSFSIEGQDVERNGLVAGAGLTFIHKSGISTSFRYKGDFRGDYKSNAIMGELRFSF
jgi:outer membrane autotransporter protein